LRAQHGSDQELYKWVQNTRQALLDACSTLQYDSAVLVGEQLGVPLLPEPFSQRQQQLSKFDGLLEEDGTRRPCVPVTPCELQGHLAHKQLSQQLECALQEIRIRRSQLQELSNPCCHCIAWHGCSDGLSR